MELNQSDFINILDEFCLYFKNFLLSKLVLNFSISIFIRLLVLHVKKLTYHTQGFCMSYIVRFFQPDVSPYSCAQKRKKSEIKERTYAINIKSLEKSPESFFFLFLRTKNKVHL